MTTLPQSQPKLSFCIPTYNRSTFIGAVLEELCSQATDECEVVVSDNASTDGTREVVASFMQRFKCLRYYRQATNVGVDRNFDRVVTLATGEFFWLMSDDDLLKPGAVARVLEVLSSNLSLVIVNMELRDLSLSKVMRRRWIDIKADRVYEPSDLDKFFIEMDYTLYNSGNIIMRRSIWLSRDRERYYGSQFIHTGVIFQARLPGRALIISTPLINYRLGNNDRWFNLSPEIFLHKWPSLVETLALSDLAKAKVRSAKPWRNLTMLLFVRSRGYSMAEYRHWIRPRVSSRYETLAPLLVAILPRSIANILSNLAGTLQCRREQLLHAVERARPPLRRAHRGQ